MDAMQRNRNGLYQDAPRRRRQALPALLLLCAACCMLSACGGSFTGNAQAMDMLTFETPAFYPSTPAPALVTSAKLHMEVHPEAVSEAPGVLTAAATLCLGMEDAAVQGLQERLMALGYFDNDELTDLYGPATENAVKLFQRVQGLEQTGVADGFLQALVHSESVLPYHMKEGDEGEDIKALQSRLKKLGYFSGKATGQYGAETMEAVEKFQKRNKLKQTGRMDGSSIDLLYSFDARPLVDPTPTPRPTPVPTPAPAAPAGQSNIKVTGNGVDGLIKAAKTHMGKPYVWGGNGPESFDCSGFLYYCLCQAGHDVGRVKAVHYSQFGDWQAITDKKSLQKGDLLFFKSDKSEVVDHAGIYLGDGKFIHASFSAGKVTTNRLSEEYFSRNFVIARRVFY